jgi:HEAT repeat protein
MRHAILGVLLVVLAGCSRREVPSERYFSGQPVSHWLQAVRGPDAKARKKAVDVLGNVGPADPAVVPALTEALGDRDARVRGAAVLALSKIGPEAAPAAERLKGLLQDKDALVRAHAATALGRVQTK